MTEDGVHVDGAWDAGCDPDALRRAFGLLEEWVADGVIPGHLLARRPDIATECHRSDALGVEIARHVPYARRDVRTRPGCAPHP